MIMHDYNPEGNKVVLMLHPMLASGRMMYDLLGSRLGPDVRCLAPDFGAHGEERGKEYVSAQVEADQIIQYLSQKGISHIDLAYGASMGGVVLTELLKRDLHCSTAYFEGTSFFVHARLLTKVLGSVFVKKHRRAVADHQRAVTAMGKLYGEAQAEEFAVQFISMSEQSIRNIAKSCGDNEPAVLTEEQQARCIFAYGSKDPNLIKAKKGWKKAYPHATFILWDGYDHCEKITADTDAYVEMLKQYV